MSCIATIGTRISTRSRWPSGFTRICTSDVGRARRAPWAPRWRARTRNRARRRGRTARAVPASGGDGPGAAPTDAKNRISRCIRMGSHYTFARDKPPARCPPTVALDSVNALRRIEMNRNGNLLVGASLLGLIVACNAGSRPRTARQRRTSAPEQHPDVDRGHGAHVRSRSVLSQERRQPRADGPDHRRGRRFHRHGVDRPPQHAESVRRDDRNRRRAEPAAQRMLPPGSARARLRPEGQPRALVGRHRHRDRATTSGPSRTTASPSTTWTTCGSAATARATRTS